MADMALCAQAYCPAFDKCYRNPQWHQPSNYQSMFAPGFGRFGCEHYISAKQETVEGSTTIKQLELKPCPFCGGKTIKGNDRHPMLGIGTKGDFVGCSNPDCKFKPIAYFDSMDESIKAWNNRARPAVFEDIEQHYKDDDDD